MLCLSTSIVLLNSTSGGTQVVLGNSDVVQITKCIASSTITFLNTLNNEMANVSVHYGPCSEIGLIHQVSNSTSELSVSENMTYGIEEVYLIGTSQVTYNFTIVESSQKTASCVANISVFLDYSNYMEFLTSGHARNPSESHCLSPKEHLAFRLNSSNGNSYNFVGLKSFVSTLINYSVTKDLLKYDITKANNVSCILSTSSSDCTIFLNSEGQEVCVLASLQHKNNSFITLSYERYSPSITFALLFLILFSLIMMTYLMAVIIVMYRKRKVLVTPLQFPPIPVYEKVSCS